MQNVRVRNPFSPYFRIPSFFSSSSPKQPLEDDVRDVEPEERDDVERRKDGDGEEEQFGSDQER
jgi:hypothetical protein